MNAFRFSPDFELRLGGAVAKAEGNLRAIRMLKRIRENGYTPNEEDLLTLAHYVGWGETAVFRTAQERLKSLLSRQEMDAARTSTLNAHYTDLDIIRAIWAALERKGVGKRTLNVLDPSAGIGHFASAAPDAVYFNARWVEIELDIVTAQILQVLRPDTQHHTVLQMGFQDAPLRDDYFDLVISNIPFGDYPVYDPRIQDARLKRAIHDYFFVRALQVVRPGGLVVFITSHFTLDKKDEHIRRYLAEQADLLAVARLPRQTFIRNAGTQVVADVIVLRKHPEPVSFGVSHPAWVEAKAFSGTGNYVNQFISNHPDVVIGEQVLVRGMYTDNEYAVSFGGEPAEIAHRLEDILLRQLPDDLLGDTPALSFPPLVKTRNEHVIKVRASDKPARRQQMEGLRAIYDAAKALLRAEVAGENAVNIALRRKKLNDVYDGFVQRHGPITSVAPRLLKDNPALPFLLALETDYKKYASSARKAEIFFRTAIRSAPALSVDSVSDALTLSLNVKGSIDMGYIARLVDKSEEEVVEELLSRHRIFRSPNGGWVLAEQYLTGNIYEKLHAAEEAEKAAPGMFRANIDALKQVIPTPLKPGEIRASLGAGWIPTDVVEGFIKHLLSGHFDVNVVYIPEMAQWSIEFTRGKWSLSEYDLYNRWGTSRRSALDIIKALLNSRPIAVYDDVDGKRVLNTQETSAADAKAEAIKAAFSTWVWNDPERAERLAKIYNETFNGFRKPAFDGSHLSFPGLNTEYTLRPHQANGVWRVLQSRTVLFQHDVGLGKTLLAIAATMELRRLGLARKVVVVAPNHTVGQWQQQAQDAYPQANILAASPKMLSKHKRGQFLSRVATGDWDLVIIPQSSFKLLPVGRETLERFYLEQISRLEYYLAFVEGRALKRVRKAIERFKTKLQRLGDMRKDRTDTITWEELGVDALIVDEFHNYKNLHFVTRMTRVAGLGNSSSETAFDMFIKSQYVLEQGGRFIGLTATPVTNSLVELYTLQRFFQMDALRQAGLEHFDAWAKNFAEAVTNVEMSPSGGGFQMKTRLAKFINLPELSGMISQFIDYMTWEMVSVNDVERPALYSGTHIPVVLPSGKRLKAYIKTLVERAEKVRSGDVKPHEDNMLLVTHHGRMAALDMRLLGDDADQPTKVARAAGVISAIHQATSKNKAAQLVFSDLGTPNRNRDFDVYHALKNALVAYGVPEGEIAFIHDATNPAKRKALYDAVRRGEVRVLIGSTGKMGTGMNVQNRLVAVHHLDAPWRPADIEQRNGRILRQGNGYRTVFSFVYLKKGSFDGYIWQLLEAKAKFIGQLSSGQISAREIDDVGQQALSLAEIKALASGNPKIMRWVALQSEIAKLSQIHRSWLSGRQRLTWRVSAWKQDVDILQQRVKRHEDAISVRDAHRNAPMVVNGAVCEKWKDVGKAVQMAAMRLRMEGNPDGQQIGSVWGFSLVLHNPVGSQDFLETEIHLVPPTGKPLVVPMSASDVGTGQRIKNALLGLDKGLESLQAEIRRLQAEIQSAEAGLSDVEWEHAAHYAAIQEEAALLKQELMKAEKDDGDTTSDTDDASPEDEFDLNEILDAVRSTDAAFTDAESGPEQPEPLVKQDVQTALAQAQFAQAVLSGWKKAQQRSMDEWLAEKFGVANARPETVKRRKKTVPDGQMTLF